MWVMDTHLMEHPARRAADFAVFTPGLDMPTSPFVSNTLLKNTHSSDRTFWERRAELLLGENASQLFASHQT